MIAQRRASSSGSTGHYRVFRRQIPGCESRPGNAQTALNWEFPPRDWSLEDVLSLCCGTVT